MPTPYGSRGGMAFSAAELHVLRRTLAHALQSSTAPLTTSEVQDCLRLAQSVDDAVQEAGRLREFLLADLVRYRGALPGSLSGYLELLQDALAAGYEPAPDDLAALRALRANPVAAALLTRCQDVAERSVRRRLSITLGAPDPAARPGRRQGRQGRCRGRGRQGRQRGARPARTGPQGAAAPGTSVRTAHPDPRRGVPAAPQAHPAPGGRARRRVATLGAWTTFPRSCPP